MLKLAIIIIFIFSPFETNVHAGQEHFDLNARQRAIKLSSTLNWSHGEPLISSVLNPSEQLDDWKVTNNEEMKKRSTYKITTDYQFHRHATADLDYDGIIDFVEFVENGELHALKINYGSKIKQPQIVSIHEGQWSDQGVFPAGPHAVMINFPESSAYFLFERSGQIMAIYDSD